MSRLPTGPLTVVSFVFGWMTMLIGVFFLVHIYVDMGLRTLTPTTGEFLRDTDPHLFAIAHLLAGFFVAKPGHRHRVLKHGALVGVCMAWVGVNVWPLFTGSGNPVSVPAIIIWLAIASLVTYDAKNAVYDKHYNETHYQH